jgi:hypothetical protein
MEDNLKLWKTVEKTNPKYTKKANVGGNQITSISPQYQIMNVTEQFGSYGKTWGFKQIELDYTLVSEFNLIVFKAIFFYPGGEFPTINSVKMFMDNAKTKIDDNFAKKVETDTLTKAISKLGFNADIFMGKFDDVRYLAEITKEFMPKIELTNEQKQNEKYLHNCKDLEALGTTWKGFNSYEQKRTEALKNELKQKLTNK